MELRAYFTSMAAAVEEFRLSLLPTWLPDEFRSLKKAFVSHPRSVGTLSGFKRYLPDLIAVSLVLNLLGLALPLTLLQVYDRILPSTATDTLTVLGIGIGVSVTLETILRICRSAVTARRGTASSIRRTARRRTRNGRSRRCGGRAARCVWSCR